MSYLLRRLFTLLITLLVISLITFITLQVVPGDPAQIILGTEASPEVLANLRHQLGLDRPLPVQYLSWLSGALRGDLGLSLRHQRPVVSLIAQRLPVTLSLTMMAMGLALALAIPLGVFAAVHRDTPADYLSLILAQVGTAVPSFWLGILLILLFALTFGWLPTGGYVPWTDDPWQALRHLMLPATALGLSLAAVLMRMTRAAMLEALGQDYIRTARAKGLHEKVVVYRHALKNALIPTVTVIGLQLGFLFGGSIVIEQLFALPGVGRLVIFAIFNRDWPLIQGLVVFIATLVVVINFVVDMIYAWVDPRISLA